MRHIAIYSVAILICMMFVFLAMVMYRMADYFGLVAFAALVAVPSTAYCFQVALRAFQQRNVMGGHLLAALPVSVLMTLSQNYIIDFISTVGFSLTIGVTMGIAGWLGMCFSVKLHERLFR